MNEFNTIIMSDGTVVTAMGGSDVTEETVREWGFAYSTEVNDVEAELARFDLFDWQLLANDEFPTGFLSGYFGRDGTSIENNAWSRTRRTLYRRNQYCVLQSDYHIRVNAFTGNPYSATKPTHLWCIVSENGTPIRFKTDNVSYFYVSVKQPLDTITTDPPKMYWVFPNTPTVDAIEDSTEDGAIPNVGAVKDYVAAHGGGDSDIATYDYTSADLNAIKSDVDNGKTVIVRDDGHIPAWTTEDGAISLSGNVVYLRLADYFGTRAIFVGATTVGTDKYDLRLTVKKDGSKIAEAVKLGGGGGEKTTSAAEITDIGFADEMFPAGTTQAEFNNAVVGALSESFGGIYQQLDALNKRLPPNYSSADAFSVLTVGLENDTKTIEWSNPADNSTLRDYIANEIAEAIGGVENGTY